MKYGETVFVVWDVERDCVAGTDEDMKLVYETRSAALCATSLDHGAYQVHACVIIWKRDPQDEDICGLCGQPGADKMAAHTGGGVLWPGQQKPDTDMVHQECEQEECERAHALLSQEQRIAFLRSI